MKRQTIAASLSLFGLAGTLALAGGCSNQSTSSQASNGIGVESILFIKRQNTICLLYTSTKNGFISASLVREIASHSGDVSRYAPALVCEALVTKFAKR